MTNSALKLEKRFLIISSSGNFLVGCGALIAAVSGSQAILLDGLFNLTYFGTGIFTIKVVLLVAGGDDEKFPYGYSYFESLINGIKGLLVFGVSIMALIGAFKSLFSGGTPIEAGVAIAYGIYATMLCWLLAIIMKRASKAINSPLVDADADNWVVNAAISSCVLIAFGLAFLFNRLGLQYLADYVDPIVVTLVILITLYVPVGMAWTSIMALVNRTPSKNILKEVSEIVDTTLSDLPVCERFIRVIQPGRHRMVLIHIVLPDDYKITDLCTLDSWREKLYHALRQLHTVTLIDVLFTADRRWGAPNSSGGFGGIIK